MRPEHKHFLLHFLSEHNEEGPLFDTILLLAFSQQRQAVDKTQLKKEQILQVDLDRGEPEEIVISGNKVSGVVNGTMRDYIAWGDSSYIHHLGAITMVDDQFIAMDSSYIDHPMTGVSWYGANAFAENYKMRLPSVAEWEKVARGISGNIYPWGNYDDGSRSNFIDSNDPWESGTTPVNHYKDENGYFDSKSPFGAYDMAGNVWEWTTDYTIGEGYALKGGSYQNPAFNQTTTIEITSFPGYLREHFGFRCVRNL